MIRRVLQSLLIASGALIVVAGAMAASKRRRPTQTPSNLTPSQRDYFQITRCRGINARPQWLLQGFGKYQCFLFFVSWREAMDQATFRVESLTSRDLVRLS